jgi:hypothetical protein
MCSVASLDLDVCILGRVGGPLALVTCLNSTAVGGLRFPILYILTKLKTNTNN